MNEALYARLLASVAPEENVQRMQRDGGMSFWKLGMHKNLDAPPSHRKDAAARRQTRILAMLPATAADICTAFNISTTTAHRDLRQLQQLGLIDMVKLDAHTFIYNRRHQQ